MDMNQQEMEAKVNEIFSDEEYVLSLYEMDTPEEVQASLAEKGLEITIEELMTIREIIINSQDGEISDEALENVSGGFFIEAATLTYIAAGLCVAALVGGGAAVIAVNRW